MYDFCFFLLLGEDWFEESGRQLFPLFFNGGECIFEYSTLIITFCAFNCSLFLCFFFFLQNHEHKHKQYKPGAVTVNLLPAIVGAGLVLLLLLPLFFLVVDPDLGTTSGLSTSCRPFLCLAPI